MSSTALRIPADRDPLILSEREFVFFRDAIKDAAGIHLSEGKRELVQSRLRAQIVRMNLDGFAAYREHLAGLPRSHGDWQTFVNLLTTNKTDFFREPAHFTYLRETVIPKWLATGQSTFRVWCAASSTGEEPYTLAMVLDACVPKDRTFSIVASDIDTNVLKKAQSGVFPRSKMVEIPPEFQRCFDPGTGEIASWMRIKPHLKSKVSFLRHNLTDDSRPPGEDFDVVFCRNVLIYFTPETIGDVMRKLHGVTRPGGLLIMGHSESLQNVKSSWSQLRPSIYAKESE